MHTLARHRRATQADMDGSHCEVWAVRDASASWLRRHRHCVSLYASRQAVVDIHWPGRT